MRKSLLCLLTSIADKIFVVYSAVSLIDEFVRPKQATLGIQTRNLLIINCLISRRRGAQRNLPGCCANRSRSGPGNGSQVQRWLGELPHPALLQRVFSSAWAALVRPPPPPPPALAGAPVPCPLACPDSSGIMRWPDQNLLHAHVTAHLMLETTQHHLATIMWFMMVYHLAWVRHC